MPAFVTNQGDKRERAQIAHRHFPAITAESVQVLIRFVLPNRNNNAASFCKLLGIGRRQVCSARCNDDGVERSLGGQTQRSITHVDMNSRVTQSLQRRCRLQPKCWDSFDAVYVSTEKARKQ